MRKHLILTFTLATLQACTDWRDTQNPNLFVMSYTALAPFPEDAQLRAIENSDPDLGGEGCKRVLTPDEAFAFNALLQDGTPTSAMTTSFGLVDARTLTLADTYTVVVKAPDNRFAGIMNTTTTRDFDGNLYEISTADYFRVEFAAIKYLAAKGCGESYEDEVKRGLWIPEWARHN